MGDREALQRALEIINTQRRKIREKLRALDETARNLEEVLRIAGGTNIPLPLGQPTVESKRFAEMTTPQATKIILEENEGPMSMSNIVIELIRGGYGKTTSRRKMYMRTYNTIKSNSAFIRLPGKKVIIGLKGRDEGRKSEGKTRG